MPKLHPLLTALSHKGFKRRNPL